MKPIVELEIWSDSLDRNIPIGEVLERRGELQDLLSASDTYLANPRFVIIHAEEVKLIAEPDFPVYFIEGVVRLWREFYEGGYFLEEGSYLPWLFTSAEGIVSHYKSASSTVERYFNRHESPWVDFIRVDDSNFRPPEESRPIFRMGVGLWLDLVSSAASSFAELARLGLEELPKEAEDTRRCLLLFLATCRKNLDALDEKRLELRDLLGTEPFEVHTNIRGD